MSILQELESSEAQYDAHVKRILCNRYVLAWILKNTTEEFCGIPINQIAEECISEDISISKVRVMPGQTNVDIVEENVESISCGNKKTERILGSNTEDKVPGEGGIFYDIRFSAYMPGKAGATKILLNLEAQKTFGGR